MKRYAILFAATGPVAGRNYLPDTNALLNSLAKCRIGRTCEGELTVFLLHHGFDPDWDYPALAMEAFRDDFQLKPLELRREDVPHPKGTNTIEFVKRARYFRLMELCQGYDAVCLLDADMFVVAPEFGGLFQLVAGTRKLIGANERFKWDVGPQSYFYADGAPIFTSAGRMRAMCCNVPSLFVLEEWREVLELYSRICFDGYQFKAGLKVGIGDLFAHNIAIHRLGRDSDVVMLPMECFAQVHHVWRKPWTYPINDGGQWRSFSGDRIYMVHDSKKIATARFVPGNMTKFAEEFAGWSEQAKFMGPIRVGLRALQREWYDLNFCQRLKLDQFMEHDPAWDTLGAKE